MRNYYVSGCVSDGESVSTCDDDVAQFWTLYHRNDDGLSEGIIDCMFREDAEAAMRVYEQRDALAAENAALKSYIDDECYIANPVSIDYIGAYSSSVETPATDAYLNSVRAEAIESFAHQQRVIADATPEHGCQRHRRFAAGLAEDFAAQLRSGEPS